jgi:hypothetical protein
VVSLVAFVVFVVFVVIVANVANVALCCHSLSFVVISLSFCCHFVAISARKQAFLNVIVKRKESFPPTTPLIKKRKRYKVSGW